MPEGSKQGESCKSARDSESTAIYNGGFLPKVVLEP
jgi:hypothetical protein